MVRVLVVLALLNALFGCATSPPTSQVPEREGTIHDQSPAHMVLPDEPEPVDAVQPPVKDAIRVESPAVVALIETADRQKQQKQYGAAAASLERAIRISPRDPGLYLALAGVRLEQGDRPQANQLCNKAIALADDGGYISYHCRQLMND